MTARAALVFMASVLLATRVHAAQLTEESTGTVFEVTQKVGSTTFTCLGAGVRKFLIFKAYANTFCLEASKADAVVRAYVEKAHPKISGDALAVALAADQGFYDALSDSKGDKLFIMKLVRDVPAEKIASAFRSSLAEALTRDEIEKLIASVPGDGKNGQTIRISSAGDLITFDLEGNRRTIENAKVAQRLWRVWMGPNSVAPSLKSSIAVTVAGRK